MKVYVKESSTGKIYHLDYNLTEKNHMIVSKREYEEQRTNIYLNAMKKLGLSKYYNAVV
jgi:hypothetical protein